MDSNVYPHFSVPASAVEGAERAKHHDEYGFCGFESCVNTAKVNAEDGNENEENGNGEAEAPDVGIYEYDDTNDVGDGRYEGEGVAADPDAAVAYAINRSSQPTKRPRDEGTIDNDDSIAPTAKKRPPSKEIQMTVAKYKIQQGSTYSVTYESKIDGDSTNNGGAPFGIHFASVRVKNAHTYLTEYFVGPSGEKYRGRPPTPSDSAIIVESLFENAPAETKMRVRPYDILLFIDDRLVNLTDKKRLKYYIARLNKDTRPMKLTFFRPEDGEVEVDEEEDGKLDRSDDAGFTPRQEEGGSIRITIGDNKSKSTPKGKEGKVKSEREKRIKLLEARLEQFETLLVETSSELHELRRIDGVTTTKSVIEERKEGVFVNDDDQDDDEVVIPPHIMYYPPAKVRRKKIQALNDACNAVESILRQRQMIDKEADKIRVVVNEAQSRLDIKELELKALDEKLAPALEQVKFIEMEVKDNWKTMYLKLKEYYEKFGHCNVMEKEDTKLAKWITRQRTCYANAQLEEPNPAMGIIKPYQYDLLNKLEFCWNPREQQFIQNINMLKQYKAEFGHTNVPMKYENIHLANFVQKWRREYRLFQEGKPSNMSQDRLQMLEEIGFSWRDPSRQRKRCDTRKETWDGFVSQLKAFHDQYGHFMVNKVNKSRGRGSRLGRLDEFCSWVRKQYILFKEGSPCQLTEAKVNQLKDLGFWLERGQANKYLMKKKLNSDEEDNPESLAVPMIENAVMTETDENLEAVDIDNERSAYQEVTADASVEMTNQVMV